MIYIFFITDTEFLVHADKKEADGLLVNFIIVLKFSTDNELFCCLHPRQTAPTTRLHPTPISSLGFVHSQPHSSETFDPNPSQSRQENRGKQQCVLIIIRSIVVVVT